MADEESPDRPEQTSLFKGTHPSDERTRTRGEVGQIGLRRFSGNVRDEILNQLKGDKKFDIYREMSENNAVIGAMLRAIDLLMRQADWQVKPVDQSDQALRDAEFLRKVIFQHLRPDWESTLSDILSFVPFGFSVHEKVFRQLENGDIVWDKLPIRRQETRNGWQFGEHGEIEAFEQWVMHSSGDKNVIPRWKFLLFRPGGSRGNPEGRSVLRSSFRSWYYRKRIEEIQAIGIERDLAGLPKMKVPPEIINAESGDFKKARDGYEDMIKNVRRDEQEGVMIPQEFDSDGNPMYEFELLSSGGERQFDTREILAQYDDRIAMTVLADFLMLGQETHGSFALASSKTNIFGMALGAWLDVVSDVFNKDAIPQLFRLNGQRRDEYPKLMHDDIEKIDLETLGTYMKNLFKAGFSFDDEASIRDALLDHADLPRAEGDGSPEEQPLRSEVQGQEDGEEPSGNDEDGDDDGPDG